MKKLLMNKPALKKLLQSHVRRMCLCGFARFFHKRKPIPDPLGAILGDKILSICVLANANFVKVRKGIAPNVPQPYFSAGKNSTEQHKSTKL